MCEATRERLSSVTEIVMGQSPPGNTYNEKGQGLPFFQGKAEFGSVSPTAVKWCTDPRRTAERGDILMSVRAPVGPTNLATERCCIGRGLAAIRADAQRLDPDYLKYFLRYNEPLLASKGQGSTFASIGRAEIAALEILLPGLDEQHRIVDLLSRAEGIVRMRREAEAKAKEIIPALFIDMFGDPAARDSKWPTSPLKELLATPLRNGISPSSSGTHGGCVLTLSAITRGQFNGTAVKAAMFSHSLSAEDEVQARDFLICRGNGNPLLVGTGCFPLKDMPGVAFPDTAIAARPDPARVLPEYLQALWKTSFIRSQIAKISKTTNGTFKISQFGLESVTVPVPAIDLQNSFALHAQRLSELSASLKMGVDLSEVTFRSLLARIFEGGA